MSSKKILICAAATAMCTIGLAQTGGATGGAGGPGTNGRSAAPSQNNMGPNQPGNTNSAVPPRNGGPDVYVRPPQQRDTAGTTPPRTTNPPNKQLPPVGTVELRPNPTTNPGSASNSGGVGAVPLPNAAAPSGAPIVTSPGGANGFQNQPLPGGITGTGTAMPTRGEFGGPTDPTVNATPNDPVNPGIDASQVDVTTGRTQTPAMQPPVAQPAGATMQPSTQPTNLSAPAGETQPRPSIPMPPPTTPTR